MIGRVVRGLTAALMVAAMAGAAVAFAVGVPFAPNSSCGTTSYEQHCPHAHVGGTRHQGRHGAGLTGFINAHGRRTGYYFEYGVCKGFPGDAKNTPTHFTSKSEKFSVPVTNLKPGTRYCYRIVVFDSKGKSVSRLYSFTTKPPLHHHKHQHH